MSETRLVLLFEPRLFIKTAWLGAMYQRDVNPLRPCPAVLTCQPSRHADDDPAATPALYGHPGTVRSLTEWLRDCTTASCAPLPKNPPKKVLLDPRLEKLLWPIGPDERTGLRRYRECQILRGLLIGASVLRTSEETGEVGDEVGVALGDYAAVHSALRGAALRPGDEPFDPLAVAMVNRANAFLAMRYQATVEPAKKARLSAGATAAQQRRTAHHPAGSVRPR